MWIDIHVSVHLFSSITDKKGTFYLREHNSVGKDMNCYMQGPEFELQTHHLFTLKKVNYSHYVT